MSRVHGIEKIAVQSDMLLTLSDINVAAGQTLVIVAHMYANALRIDGSAELDGHLDITGYNNYYTNIETITGGAQSDILRGLGGDDILRGNGGNDTIDGGKDFDTAVFSGNRANYSITEDNGERRPDRHRQCRKRREGHAQEHQPSAIRRSDIRHRGARHHPDRHRW